MPNYRDAAYGGQTVTLENQYLRLNIHKRLTGWGWGELFALSSDDKRGRFFAVLEHLGEVDIAGFVHPLRLEASDYKLDGTDKYQKLTFEVQPQEAEAPNKVFDGKPPLKGTVALTLPDDEAVVYYEMVVETQFTIYLRSLRGVWLRVGADSFGVARHDAIFPGVEWVIDKEWSSGTDWFEHPEALRVTPHPHKVAIPIMAISYDGSGIGLSWTPELPTSLASSFRWPQPVFATPNFVDRRNHHLLGLMLPSVREGLKENDLKADPPVKMRRGQKLTLDSQISIVRGTSLDVVVDWVKRHGMPEPGRPRYEWRDALERIARAYNGGLWVDGKGWRFFGLGYEPEPYIPEFVLYYIDHGSDKEIVRGLKEKVAWCRARDHRERPSVKNIEMPSRDYEQIRRFPRDEAIAVGEELLKIQTPEGDFPFDPEGRHKTQLSDWSSVWRPLGQPGDSVIGLCAVDAAVLILAGQTTGEQKFIQAARKTLDFAMKFERPEGGDWWETPLHSPNILAAGNAAIAYYLGYKEFGDERYLERARHWIRCVIPFTHLWEPEEVQTIYNTKPCFCTTSWFLADWVARHVQWEILEVFATSAKLGIDWAQVDPEIDWNRYHRGVTTAVLRWMIDHNDPEWMRKSKYPPALIVDGTWDGAYSDTFDPVSNTYVGGPIVPGLIARNILLLLEKEEIK
ncbi:MAG: hypothetical protein ACUVXI_16135 [bacterium]